MGVNQDAPTTASMCVNSSVYLMTNNHQVLAVIPPLELIKREHVPCSLVHSVVVYPPCIAPRRIEAIRRLMNEKNDLDGRQTI
jgi:hypothetical protein